MVVIVYVGTTCINSEPNVASVSSDYFTYTTSSEAATLPNQTSGNLFIDIVTKGKER